jgi:L-ascorbate metabolism protein UlaG (beta-lactamase superfamily)
MLNPRLMFAQASDRPTVLTFSTFHNPVNITPLYHASLLMEEGNKAIYVDPAKPARFSGLPPADLILITDIHPDHMDPGAVAEIISPGTEIIAPATVVKALGRGHALANGEMTNLFGWFIAAVPMYNLKRGPALGQVYNEKGRGNGYVLTYGSKSFYISGETEGIPEMRTLKGIDVAFLCMDLPYTMSPDEAADEVKAFRPGIVIPYAYRGSDPHVFAKDLEGTGIEVRLVDWYPKTR